MSYQLVVKCKKGNFLKNYDTFGKMDPFIKVTVGNDATGAQKTDVAQGQGKTPVWKKVLVFNLNQTQYNNLENLPILFEAFDEDVTSDEYIGKISVKLSQVKLKLGENNTLTLVDAKNATVGTIDVEFEFKQGPPMATSTKGGSPQKRNVLGTLMVRPGQGKFESSSGVADYQELYLVLIHGEVAYQSGVSEGTGRKPLFRDIITFQHFESEDVIVRCFDNDPERNDMIGEGHINLSQIVKKGFLSQSVPLQNAAKKNIGEIHFELEATPEVFNNPVKVYPIVSIKRGEYVSKKIKYSNPDKFKKNLTVRTANREVILVKTEHLTILPGETGEIRFKFFAPQNSRDKEETCRIDVVVEDTQIIEESLLFKIKAL